MVEPGEHRYPDDVNSRVRLVAAAYVLLIRADGPDPEVLLHLRQHTGYRDGHWALVAGHVETGESVVAAALREAHEEVGVTVAAADLVPVTTVHRTVAGGGPIEQRVDVFFAADRWAGEPEVREPGKNAGVQWWPLGQVVASLPEPCVPHELRVIELVAAAGWPPATWAPGAVPAVLTHGF